ncbi:hypothetical protein [Streptomyces sp. HUAS TT20]|uniref:hypothetical protein n=1 Tax=Streptomyces sp. HUAS TT20 TaxID=3447509 RepID=UPI0021DB1102|nr:hypothetical protein [Streptomyces sp. HUAS 15-9]UXY30826.1 hypothetical protein N8I87_32580 [Streptomyces sp. HUAS 15-9]
MQIGKAAISAALAASVLGGIAGATTASATTTSKGSAAVADYERRPGGGWLDSWKSSGKKGQKSAAHPVKKGKHFFHFGIKGRGEGWTAAVYKSVKGKDPKIQSLKGKANGTEYFADPKKYSAGNYYIVWNYAKKGKTVWGGIE